MAKWSKDRNFPPVASRDDWEWDCGDPYGLQNSFRSLSPISLLDFDLWDKSLFKSQKSSAWSCMGLSGTGLRSKISTSTLGSQCGMKQSESAGLRRWQSASRLAPQSCTTQGVELQTALEDSSTRRAELVQRLREAHGHLDTQTDLLKAKETQLQHSQNATHKLQLKHKQLAKALSALEEQKEAAEQSRFEESRRRTELQEKVIQLEMDLLKMKSSLGSRNTDQTSASQTNPQLSRTMPVTSNDFIREGEKHARKEMKKLKEELREAEERAESLEEEKDHTLKQLYSSRENYRKALNQTEVLKQKLHTSMQARNDLQDQLIESRSRLSQLELEKDSLSTKTLRLEGSLEDLKAKLSAALADKDRLVQEKADLHQKCKGLELQLQRAQLGKEGFTEQMCELHSELAQAKSQANNQQQNTLLMKEELQSVKEVNEKLTTDLTAVTERLQMTLKQLHELEAERLIHNNQITALEAERLQLIGEKEKLMDVFDQGNQEELRELRQRCYQLRELRETLEHEKQELQTNCHGLENKVQNIEAELGCKEKELKRMEMELEQGQEELKKVAAHWNDRWLDVAMTLQSTQAELAEAKKQQQDTDALSEEAAGIHSVVEALETQLKDSQDQIQKLLEQNTQLQTELCRVKKEAGALERVELDACRQQLELEQSRTQSLQRRLMGTPVSLEEMDGELVQMKAELQKVWDMLKSRDNELEEQQQELESARGQVTQQNSEVQRLEKQLSEKDQELNERALTLKNLRSQRDTETTEAKNKITALEKELAGLKKLNSCSDQHDTQAIDSLKAQLDESRRTVKQLKQERDQTVEGLHTLKPPQQSKEEKVSPSTKRKEKSVSFDLMDPDQQRRLITEQLKTLFKEREKLGDKASPVLQRRVAPGVDRGPKSKAIKESVTETLSSESNKPQKHVQELSVQRGAGESPPVNPEKPQSQPEASEKGAQDQLKQDPNCNTAQQISTLSVGKDEQNDKNENLLKAKLKFQQQNQNLRVAVSCGEERSAFTFCLPAFINKEEETPQMRTLPLRTDGTFLARQVEVCDSEVEDNEESIKLCLTE